MLIALTIVIVLLVAAAVYTTWAKHPDTRPLAAYLIFVLPFSATAFVIFAASITLLQLAGKLDFLAHPVSAVLLVLIIVVPAFIVGRWQLGKPPRSRRLPD